MILSSRCRFEGHILALMLGGKAIERPAFETYITIPPLLLKLIQNGDVAVPSNKQCFYAKENIEK
jgi:hypothetical protein